MGVQYTIVYDESTVPKRANSHRPFSQVIHDWALISKAPGDHPSGFLQDLESLYNFIRSSVSRRQYGVEFVPFVKHKLIRLGLKSFVQCKWKASHPTLRTLFTLPGGSSLDPYSAIITFAIATMRVRIKCTVVEQDSDCHKYAVIRLEFIAGILHQNESCKHNDARMIDD